jgi:hypothetical protein
VRPYLAINRGALRNSAELDDAAGRVGLAQTEIVG